MDRAAYGILEQKQRETLDKVEPFTIETPADTLRQRLLKAQGLPYAGSASLGTKHLAPVPHWPKDDYLTTGTTGGSPLAVDAAEPLRLSLTDALRIAAGNNRDYQSRKEDVFRSALDLDFERYEFRTSFSGLIEGAYSQDRMSLGEPGGEVQAGLEGSAVGGVSKTLESGAALTARIGWDLARLLEPTGSHSRSLFGDASITIPLLRGAGRHIVAEPLQQAERNVVYAIYGFERYKHTFAVQVAGEYFSVLQNSDQVKNAAENYRGLIASTRRARRLLDAGDLPPIQVDQAIQDELRARNRWVSARESLERALDSFKTLLGLPADARIELDREEFDRLAGSVEKVRKAAATSAAMEEKVPPADAPITLVEPTRENAGPLELDEGVAIRLALENRLDLRVAEGKVYDAQRKVVVAADRLRPELTLLGEASVGEHRGVGSADNPGADRLKDLDPNNGAYSALLTLDLPFKRRAEAIAYRESYIALEQAAREVQDFEDGIKLDVRDQLRILRVSRESLRIQTLAVELAERRVRGADLNLQAGRIQIRDLLEAREDLLSAQNALTAAVVDYRIAELELQRDLGVLEVGADGLWREFNPEEMHHEQSESK